MQSRCETSLLCLETPEQHGPVLPHGERGGEQPQNLAAFFTPGLVVNYNTWSGGRWREVETSFAPLATSAASPFHSSGNPEEASLVR